MCNFQLYSEKSSARIICTFGYFWRLKLSFRLIMQSIFFCQSSAIWNKLARVKFSKTNKISGLYKLYKCSFIQNCMGKIMRLLINNWYMQKISTSFCLFHVFCFMLHLHELDWFQNDKLDWHIWNVNVLRIHSL